MAFRDETEALRQQRTILRSEIEDLETERTRVESEIESEAVDVERTVRLKVGGAVTGVVIVGLLVPTIVLAAVFLDGGGGSGDADMLFGEVVETTGAAPFSENTRCTVFIHYVSGKNSPGNGQIEVVCNGTTVYGGDGLGFLDCEWGEKWAMSCVDEDYTDDGGDPKLTFDRLHGLVLIEDGRSDIQVPEGRFHDYQMQIQIRLVRQR